MAGPDSKRLYLSIVAQNLDNIKSERAYWNKNFISLTPSGAGTKYTTLQAAMMLKKMQVVKFLARHPAIDLTVKATDGRTTLMIAAQSSMPVSVLQKILEKYDLKTINECDALGKTALDLAEPGTESEFGLLPLGPQYTAFMRDQQRVHLCAWAYSYIKQRQAAVDIALLRPEEEAFADIIQDVPVAGRSVLLIPSTDWTKAARDACLQGFFVSAGKAVHQRVRKKGETRREGKSNSCPPADGDKRRSEEESLPRSRSEESNGPEGSCSEQVDSEAFDDCETVGLKEEEGGEVDYEEESPWQLFNDPHDLLRVLQSYLDTWGHEGEEGELCHEWVVYVKKKIKKNAASEAVAKWNKLVVSVYGEENISEYRKQKNTPEGKATKAPGADSDTRSRADEARQEVSEKSGSSMTSKHPADERRKTSPRLDKQHRTQRDVHRAQGKEGNEIEERAGEAPVERARTIPESLRGFFNPHAAITEENASPPPQKSPPEGGRRRTLGVWLDKSDARERFADVVPKCASGDSRRRHKKGSKN